MCYYVCFTAGDFFLSILALFFPPFAVAFRSGLFSSDLLLNILLTMFGILPGVLHAWYYITITSPLRRDAEYTIVYQQGWIDTERYANGEHSGYPAYIQNQQVQEGTPLMAARGDNKIQDQNAPPPYTRSN